MATMITSTRRAMRLTTSITSVAGLLEGIQTRTTSTTRAMRLPSILLKSQATMVTDLESTWERSSAQTRMATGLVIEEEFGSRTDPADCGDFRR